MALPVRGDHEAPDVRGVLVCKPTREVGHEAAVIPDPPRRAAGIGDFPAELLERLSQRRHRQVAVRLRLGYVTPVLQRQDLARIIDPETQWINLDHWHARSIAACAASVTS